MCITFAGLHRLGLSRNVEPGLDLRDDGLGIKREQERDIREGYSLEYCMGAAY